MNPIRPKRLGYGRKPFPDVLLASGRMPWVLYLAFSLSHNSANNAHRWGCARRRRPNRTVRFGITPPMAGGWRGERGEGLTCLAHPKSASFTVPLLSTRMLSHLRESCVCRRSSALLGKGGEAGRTRCALVSRLPYAFFACSECHTTVHHTV